MILRNDSSETIHLTMVGKSVAPAATVQLADEYRRNEDIDTLIDAGKLTVISWSTDDTSLVTQEEFEENQHDIFNITGAKRKLLEERKENERRLRKQNEGKLRE